MPLLRAFGSQGQAYPTAGRALQAQTTSTVNRCGLRNKHSQQSPIRYCMVFTSGFQRSPRSSFRRLSPCSWDPSRNFVFSQVGLLPSTSRSRLTLKVSYQPDSETLVCVDKIKIAKNGLTHLAFSRWSLVRQGKCRISSHHYAFKGT